MCYTADLTSLLSTGESAPSVNSFRDVAMGGYRVIVQDATSPAQFLRTAEDGSAMHEVYYGSMEGDPDAFVSTPEACCQGFEHITSSSSSSYMTFRSRRG